MRMKEKIIIANWLRINQQIQASSYPPWALQGMGLSLAPETCIRLQASSPGPRSSSGQRNAPATMPLKWWTKLSHLSVAAIADRCHKPCIHSRPEPKCFVFETSRHAFGGRIRRFGKVNVNKVNIFYCMLLIQLSVVADPKKLKEAKDWLTDKHTNKQTNK